MGNILIKDKLITTVLEITEYESIEKHLILEYEMTKRNVICLLP